MRWIAGAATAVVLLLDLLLATCSFVRITASASIDPATVVHDEGHAWRTLVPLLQGRLVAAVPEGGWSPWPMEARLLESETPLTPASAPHQELRALGAGRWSFWRGQVYFSTNDGSDPRSNGRSYRLEAPLRPTMLLLGGTLLANLGAILLLRRCSTRVRRGCDSAMAALLQWLPSAGPGIAGRCAPLLLACAILGAFAGPYGSDRWMAWDYSSPEHRFIPPYLATLDFWVAGLFVLTALATRTAPTPALMGALLLVLLCTMGGGIARASELSWQPQITAVILALRFSCAFLASWCVVRAGGVRALAPALLLLGIIWVVGVVLGMMRGEGQFIVVGGHFPSFAGMTLGLLAIVAIHRHALVLAAIAAVAVIATGSRGAIVGWPIAWLLPALCFGRGVLPGATALRAGSLPAADARTSSPWRRAGVGVALVVVVGVVALLASEQIRSYLAFKLAHTSWLSMGRRVDMVQWTFETIAQVGWRPFGWGYGQSPAFIARGIELGTMQPGWGNLHVLWLQWMVELGLFALPLVALILWRAAAAWWRTPLAASIWLFFLLSQSIDYWLWTRDGLIVWGLFLALAEAMRQDDAAAPASCVSR